MQSRTLFFVLLFAPIFSIAAAGAPYCNAQLANMHTVEPKLREAGYEVLFVPVSQRMTGSVPGA
jgi:hypothetical protein